MGRAGVHLGAADPQTLPMTSEDPKILVLEGSHNLRDLKVYTHRNFYSSQIYISVIKNYCLEWNKRKLDSAPFAQSCPPITRFPAQRQPQLPLLGSPGCSHTGTRVRQDICDLAWDPQVPAPTLSRLLVTLSAGVRVRTSWLSESPASSPPVP